MGANTVVVGVDGSEGSALALRWAVDLAARCGWSVEALMSWSYLEQHHPDRDDRFDPDYDETAAAAALDAYVASALGDGAAAVERRVVLDLASRALLEAATGAALLVVGARGLGGFKGLVLGSVSQHCLHHASGPVAVVHESTVPATTGRIVVGLDGSSNSLDAVAWAADRAAATGASVELVHAWHMPYIGGEPFVSPPFTWADCEKGARSMVEAALDAATIDHREVLPDPTLTEGPAARTLIDASDGASMVVLGARGRGGFAGLLLGSVSTQVVRHAHCPVVVLPGDDR